MSLTQKTLGRLFRGLAIWCLLGGAARSGIAQDRVPPPLLGQDIGQSVSGGAEARSDGAWTGYGKGEADSKTRDHLHFVYARLRGDGQFLARVEELSPPTAQACAGVMLRASLAADAPCAGVLVTSQDGPVFQARTQAGLALRLTQGIHVSMPCWVRITRAGRHVIGSVSRDGKNWTVVSSANLSMRDPAYIGLAVTGMARFNSVHMSPEQASSADRFVDSIGVNTHFVTGLDSSSIYSRFDRLKPLLLASGIRHIRDGFCYAYNDDPHSFFPARLQELAAGGVFTDLVTSAAQAAPELTRDAIKVTNTKQPRPVEAVEGPNETDTSGISYRGMGFPAGIIAYQKDLWAAIKSDPATSGLTVIGPSLGGSYYRGHLPPLGDLHSYVNWGNQHNYAHHGDPWTLDIHNNQPSVMLPFMEDVIYPSFGDRPIAATETGYWTVGAPFGISPALQEKYVPRLFAEFYNAAVPRTYLYEFVDEPHVSGLGEQHYGLVQSDFTPKPAYTAVSSLIQILQEKNVSPSFIPANLGYRISGKGDLQQVHHTLLQKSDGDFYLLLWREVSGADLRPSQGSPAMPPVEQEQAAIPVTLMLPSNIRAATLYEASQAGVYSPRPLNVQNGRIAVSVPDSVIVFKFAPVF